MTALAALLDDDSARRLAAARKQAEHGQGEASPAPVRTPARRLPPAPVVFQAPGESRHVGSAAGSGPMTAGR
jgi:hypothetical protein